MIVTENQCEHVGSETINSLRAAVTQVGLLQPAGCIAKFTMAIVRSESDMTTGRLGAMAA